MKAGDRYFMPAVAILQALEDLKMAKIRLEEGLPLSAVACMRNVATSMIVEIEKVMTARLSDPEVVRKHGCRKQCGYTAVCCGRPECEENHEDPTGR